MTPELSRRLREDAVDRRRAWAALLLEDHWPHPVFGCACAPTDSESGITSPLKDPWEKHIADLLYPPGAPL